MKEKKGSGIKYLLIIPLGLILFIYLFDVVSEFYYKEKLESDLKSIMKETLTASGTNTDQDYINIAKQSFEDKGYKKSDLYMYKMDDKTTGFIVVGYKTYSKIGKQFINIFIDFYNEITGSSKKYNTKRTISAGIKAYYNDYKEVEIEDYNEDLDELEYQS